MRLIDAREVTLDVAWDAISLAHIQDATVRLHWTDQPYVWHVNEGTEVFAVLDGQVDMHYEGTSGVAVARLIPGQVFVAESGDAHVAHPVGTARILVIEKCGSI